MKASRSHLQGSDLAVEPNQRRVLLVTTGRRGSGIVETMRGSWSTKASTASSTTRWVLSTVHAADAGDHVVVTRDGGEFAERAAELGRALA